MSSQSPELHGRQLAGVQFTAIGDRAAATTSVLLLFVLSGDDPLAQAAIIRCNDELVRTGNDEWRFRRRSSPEAHDHPSSLGGAL